MSALRREGRREDTGGRTIVELLVLLVCGEPWEVLTEGTWSPRVKNEGGSRVAEDVG